jgi:membrane protease YdiL (CAAX protease family)
MFSGGSGCAGISWCSWGIHSCTSSQGQSSWAERHCRRWGTNWRLLFTWYLPTLLLLQGTTQWAEEPGWRGFALPRLQERFGPVPGSLILGLLHGLWHLPLFVYTGGPVAQGPFDLSTFVLYTLLLGTVMTIIWTWVYNNTGGSILLAVLLHSAFNATSAAD